MTLVVEDADLSDVVVDLARAIADNAPMAVAAAKHMVADPTAPALDALVDGCRNSKDYRTGLDAVRRGTRPVFEGL